MDNVVITGGAQGIGHYLVQAYATTGYQVISLDILDCSFPQENIKHYVVDLSKPSEIQACFKAIYLEFGAINILINNAAISKFNKDIRQTSIEEYDLILNTNLRGAYVCIQEFIKYHNSETYSRIINIASTRYHQNEADWELYGASKGGLVALTNSLCISLSNTNISVNAISPGWIQVSDYDSLSLNDHQQHPAGRVGTPEDIYKACAYLSIPSNNFINGANLMIDGGMSKKMIYE